MFIILIILIKKIYKRSENLLNYSLLWYVKCILLLIIISLVWFVFFCFIKKIIKECYSIWLRNIDYWLYVNEFKNKKIYMYINW